MFKTAREWIRKFEKPLTVLAGSIALSALLINLDFHFLEANLYDFRMSHEFQNQADPNIALITLDDKTTKELDDFAPLTLSLHARFLTALEQLSPKAVGYIVDMNHVSQTTSEPTRQKGAVDFVQAATQIKNKGIPFLLGTPFDVTGEVLPPFPLSSLPHAIAIIHKDGNVFSEDKITRRALLTLYGKPAFHLRLAQVLNYQKQDFLPSGSYAISEVDGEYFFFKYHGNTKLQRNNPSTPYLRYSFSDVLQGRISKDALKGKVVLVGPLSKDDSSDFAFTPYSRASFTNPKLVVHANILDSIINNESIVRAPSLANGLITFAATTVVLWWIITSTPLYGVFATLGLALFIVVACQALFQFKGIWVTESQPLVAVFVSYYLAVPYRLIREYKKRWAYQRKNELLTQVEEMKTNFISLVTHDLKTPVAKIQGLTEVLSRSVSRRLSPTEAETLQHIMGATEELNHFITSILELNKIESNHLRFQFESKDINNLIEKSIERFQGNALAKNIQLSCQLDPLFPIRIDVNLIDKVLNNIIDNALKYSSKDSVIQISSREENNWVVISVVDQGIGMTKEEQNNLFTRFYRAKNDMTAAIPGTGIGLYLTKYFIEAHNGHVEVESQKKLGTTFRIFLPIEGPTKEFELRGNQLCLKYL